jgi:hypothetical protein
MKRPVQNCAKVEGQVEYQVDEDRVRPTTRYHDVSTSHPQWRIRDDSTSNK